MERQELLPGLPDEVVLQSVVPRLPYYTRALASTLSRRWRQTLRELEGDPRERQRWRRSLRHHSGLLLRYGPSCRLIFLDFSDMCLHPLPPPPFAHRGLGAKFTFVFSVNQRIFAVQRACTATRFAELGQPMAAISVERLFMLDIGAGLFRWQQRLGRPSHLHRPHCGDISGLKVSAPSMCAIVGSKVYVIADRMPPSIESVDVFEAIRYYGQTVRGIAAAMYDACEDSWEEIPSPLCGRPKMQLLGLHCSKAGVMARVCNEHSINSSLTFLYGDRCWHDTSNVMDTICAAPSGSCISARSYIHFDVNVGRDKAVCTCCGGVSDVTCHVCTFRTCLCTETNIQKAARRLMCNCGWRNLPESGVNSLEEEGD